MVDPPWVEYQKRIMHMKAQYDEPQFKPWSLFEISKLDIASLCSSPAFIFLWCGADHLLDARTLFNQWGFKRCDDVV